MQDVGYSPAVQARIHELQKEAYVKVLRVLCAQPLDWNTEDLLTDMRSLLNISNDEHMALMKDCRPGGKLSIASSQELSRGGGMGMGRGMPPMGGGRMMMSAPINNRDIIEAHQSLTGKMPDGIGGGMPGLGGSHSLGGFPY